MKPAKTFVVEVKKNGRRSVQRYQTSIWNTEVLKAATETVNDEQDPDLIPNAKVSST
ncbi:hypothetical protein [Phyllobacterium chamaecytisi]|uniref:hypothetical protein n=1 Tax=Phyllobacterium chamaecytisi TaxID=2876082 RepID=UPI001CCED165|nr:hypothetical protein [Phyllobacterium sp. KW56]MBZ9603324.1 hypothetical protein [Phyllobacterium sp. KW56]